MRYMKHCLLILTLFFQLASAKIYDTKDLINIDRTPLANQKGQLVLTGRIGAYYFGYIPDTNEIVLSTKKEISSNNMLAISFSRFISKLGLVARIDVNEKLQYIVTDKGFIIVYKEGKPVKIIEP